MAKKKIPKAELKRLHLLNQYEDAAREKGFNNIAGVDEVGRGPLAGPVVAAACIIPQGVFFPGINDSKQLLPAKRAELFIELTTHPDVIYGIGIVSHEEIDRINIYQASIKAMLSAIEQLKLQPDIMLVDGLFLPHPQIPSQKIIKGDSLSQSIAAASIIAKETRDLMMKKNCEEWPLYVFGKHKGYATASHLQAIKAHGPCPIHRKSFEPIKSMSIKEEQLVLPLV